MPKIIENLENRLMEEAVRQIEAEGYSAMTIRSVAKACGVGVGTVYNYFPSKEDLLARHLLQSWQSCITAINAVSTYCDSPEPVLRCIHDQLCAYANRHSAIFSDQAALFAYAGAFGKYHALLRSQLAAPVQKFCEDSFAAEFIAEALLTWTMAGKDFDSVWGMLQKLF